MQHRMLPMAILHYFHHLVRLTVVHLRTMMTKTFNQTRNRLQLYMSGSGERDIALSGHLTREATEKRIEKCFASAMSHLDARVRHLAGRSSSFRD